MKFLYMQKIHGNLKKYTYSIDKSPISYCKCLILSNIFSDIEVNFENVMNPTPKGGGLKNA